MRSKLFLSRLSNIVADNRILRFAVICILVVTVYNSYLLQKSLDSRHTVIIPRGLNEKIEVKNDYIDDKCVKQFARDVVESTFTYHPMNVRTQFEDVLTLYAPEVYQDAFDNFYQLANEIVKANISSVAYIQGDITVDPLKKLIEVKVLLRRYKGDQKLEDKQKRVVITYKVENSKFQLLKISENKEGA